MINVNEWAEVRRLHFGEHLGVKTIARRLGLARNTVRSAIRSTGPPKYERKPRGSAVDGYEPRIRELLAEHPEMPASVIAERVGWARGATVFRQRVAELRPLYALQEPYQRTEYRPGELAQWDLWFPPMDIPVGPGMTARLPVLVGALGYSRVSGGEMIPSRMSEDLIAGMWACIQRFGAVPRGAVWDNESGIGRRVAGKLRLTEPFARFCGLLGMKPILLRPAFPEGKGVVERDNEYYETSFLPGRTFTSVADFNAQFHTWLDERANVRMHRTLRCRPSQRLAADRAAMMPLPPIHVDTTHRFAVRLPRDHFIRFGTCDYSVHPKAVGRMVDVRVDLTSVVATLNGDDVARHARCLAPHQTISDEVHIAARDALRKHHHHVPTLAVDVEVRDLASYDRIFAVATA